MTGTQIRRRKDLLERGVRISDDVLHRFVQRLNPSVTLDKYDDDLLLCIWEEFALGRHKPAEVRS